MPEKAHPPRTTETPTTRMEPYKNAVATRGRRSDVGVTTRGRAASETRVDATTNDPATENPATPAETAMTTATADQLVPADANPGSRTKDPLPRDVQDPLPRDVQTATPSTEQLAEAVVATFNVSTKEGKNLQSNECVTLEH
jgi:hypothetical protein